MLVDLARNDVNRVCQPKTVKVDHLMRLDRFSHVIHMTSMVSGILRTDKTRSGEEVLIIDAYIDIFAIIPGSTLLDPFSQVVLFLGHQKSRPLS